MGALEYLERALVSEHSGRQPLRQSFVIGHWLIPVSGQIQTVLTDFRAQENGQGRLGQLLYGSRTLKRI